MRATFCARLERSMSARPQKAARAHQHELRAWLYGRQTLKPKELHVWFTQARDAGKLQRNVNFNGLMQLLEETCGVTPVVLRSEAIGKTSGQVYPEIRVLIHDRTSPFGLALGLRKGAYLSHGTAAHLHGLREAPTPIYVNKEQSTKPPATGNLTQASLDRAFQNKARASNFEYAWGEHRIVILAGKNSGRLGVVEKLGPLGESLEITDLERTLVDLAVRPQYGGGPEGVLEAFRRANARVDVPKLEETLHRLGHVYPYHQALGFYLEAAGRTSNDVKSLLALKTELTLPLANQIGDPVVDRRWGITFPRGLV